MPNPFERLLEDRPGTGGTVEGAFGMLGRSLGVPTQQERFGGLQGEALSKLNEFVQSGATPQQAVTKLMSTPQGLAVFNSGDPNALNFLTQWAKTVAPTPPTMTNTPPGNILTSTTAGGASTQVASNPQAPNITPVPPGYGALSTNQQGQSSVVLQQPNTAEQNLTVLQKFARDIPADQMGELAKTLLIPEKDRMALAVDQMIRKNIIPEDIGLKIKSGVLHIKDEVNPYGEKTGNFQIIDLSNPGNPVAFTKPGATSQTGGVAPPSIRPTAENPLGIADFGKASVFLGTGLWSQGIGITDAMVRNTFGPDVGSDAGKIANERTRAIKILDAAITSFPEVAGRSNKVINAWQALRPGLLSDNVDSLGAAIQLHKYVTDEAHAEQAIVSNSQNAKEVRLEAQKRQNGYDRILRALPPMNDLVVLREAVVKGKGGAYTPQTGVDVIKDIVGKGVGAATDTFNSVTGRQPTQDNAVPQLRVMEPDAAQPQAKPMVGPKVMEGDLGIPKMSFEALHQFVSSSRFDQATPQQKQLVRERLEVFKAQRKKAK